MFLKSSLLTVAFASVCLVIFPAVHADTDDTDDVEQTMPGPPDYCLEGPYHKDAPSPEEEEFTECSSWQDLTCCTIDLDESIRISNSVGLYNYLWDVCGNLSAECEEYIKDEECFYQCEPMLGYFQIDNTGYINRVPVCAHYCDAWFEACRNDFTCVEDWLDDYNYEHGNNTCPADAECVTFEKMYGNGEGLCNRMWGDAFFYETSDNCTVMAFDPDGENPNLALQLPVSSAKGRYATRCMMWMLVIMIALVQLAIF